MRDGGCAGTTRYFEEQVLRKRPYLERAWLTLPLVRTERQADGRLRGWALVEAAPPDRRPRWLRIVFLEDGSTVHNAVFDRDFAPPEGAGEP